MKINMNMSYRQSNLETAKQEESDLIKEALNHLEEKKANKEDVTQNAEDLKWQLEIESISLDAPIAEGIDEDTLNKYVGHFEETSFFDGNVGLAAHNRGYPVNHFERIKELKIGDEINYLYNNKKRIYEVTCIKIIKDTDWTMLENTKENLITLITCVENQPELRRCIQATEIN